MGSFWVERTGCRALRALKPAPLLDFNARPCVHRACVQMRKPAPLLDLNARGCRAFVEKTRAVAGL